MSIYFDKTLMCMVAECDECADTVEFEPGETWHQAKNYIDDDGWNTKHRNGQWINICPDCQE